MTEFETLLRAPLERRGAVYLATPGGAAQVQEANSDAFTAKWDGLTQADEDDEAWKTFQFDWYLKCYGFADMAAWIAFLATKTVILDAGCGPGYKAAWMAKLAPHATVVAMDLSSGVMHAAARYQEVPNLYFVQGDIADTPFVDAAFDLVSCDQVLHHTLDPPKTVAEFNRILKGGGHLNTYVYAKKALPRELLDDHFRSYAAALSKDEIWALSEQLTELGKTLSDLKITLDVPDMPALQIKGGKMDLQRFIYWNFLKCFWNEGHGRKASTLINFDWYSPTIAYRYTEDEFVGMLREAGFASETLHSEEACHTGRFAKADA